MNYIKTVAVLSFMAFLSLGVTGCWDPTNPTGGGGGGRGGGGKGGGGNGGGGTGDSGRDTVIVIDTMNWGPDSTVDTLRTHHK